MNFVVYGLRGKKDNNKKMLKRKATEHMTKPFASSYINIVHSSSYIHKIY